MVGFTNGEFVANKLNVDNVQVDGNTIISTDTNGNINLTPNGTGGVVANTNTTIASTGVTTNLLNVDNLRLDANTIISTNSNGAINITPDGTGSTVANTYTTITNSEISLNRDQNASNSISITNNYDTSAGYSQFRGYARGDAGGTTTISFALSARTYLDGFTERANRANLACSKNGFILRFTESTGSFTVYDSSGAQMLLLGSTGCLRLVKQPSFHVRNTIARSNITGVGTAYTIPFNSISGGFDQGSNFNLTTGVFTAPITGRYFFGWLTTLSGLATATRIRFALTKSTGIVYRYDYGLPALTSDSYASFSDSMLCGMAANDTIELILTVSGIASDTVDVLANLSDVDRSVFFGYLAN